MKKNGFITTVVITTLMVVSFALAGVEAAEQKVKLKIPNIA